MEKGCAVLRGVFSKGVEGDWGYKGGVGWVGELSEKELGSGLGGVEGGVKEGVNEGE